MASVVGDIAELQPAVTIGDEFNDIERLAEKCRPVHSLGIGCGGLSRPAACVLPPPVPLSASHQGFLEEIHNFPRR